MGISYLAHLFIPLCIRDMETSPSFDFVCWEQKHREECQVAPKYSIWSIRSRYLNDISISIEGYQSFQFWWVLNENNGLFVTSPLVYGVIVAGTRHTLTNVNVNFPTQWPLHSVQQLASNRTITRLELCIEGHDWPQGAYERQVATKIIDLYLEDHPSWEAKGNPSFISRLGHVSTRSLGGLQTMVINHWNIHWDPILQVSISRQNLGTQDKQLTIFS